MVDGEKFFKTIAIPVIGGILGAFLGTIIGDLTFVPLTAAEWGPVGFLVGLLAPFLGK